MKLKQMREKSGLRTSKVAEELGITRVQLYNLEKGKYKLGKLKREKLSVLYGVTELEIMKAEEESIFE